MSTTLTNGLKLPDKGSVDWYADMQSNYTILDGAVGTVAEHTSALSGKAPLVHTHTKSDVTDLLNSNFIPSANNTYDLGSSSYQWNNVYAKQYYLNGVAWGLDKANEWSGENSFNNANLNRKYNFTFGDNSYRISRIQYQDKNSTRWGVLAFVQNTDNSVYCDIGVNCLKNDGQTVLNKSIRFLIQPDNTSEFKPINDKAIDLGTSTFRWKTLNGINPGALSLPDTTREEPIDTTNWVYSYTAANIYYPPEDGWLAVACSGSNYMQLDGNAGWGITLSKGYDGFCTGIIPVKKNVKVQIRIRETSSDSVVIRKASFYPGTGDPSFTVTPLNNS